MPAQVPMKRQAPAPIDFRGRPGEWRRKGNDASRNERTVLPILTVADLAASIMQAARPPAPGFSGNARVVATGIDIEFQSRP